MRRIVYEREEDRRPVPSDVVIGMVRVLDAEINLIEKVEGAKRMLAETQGFNILNLFCGIDRGTAVTEAGLLDFCARLGFTVGREDIAGVVRRIDHDRDGVICYTEFVDSILPTEIKVNLMSPVKGVPRRAEGSP
ncbi:MAG: hypothetical protein V2I33_22975 [Kangiellaceae bacterium]|nr:hypothetical protein [Kangiellaceae bacterium]